MNEEKAVAVAEEEGAEVAEVEEAEEAERRGGGGRDPMETEEDEKKRNIEFSLSVSFFLAFAHCCAPVRYAHKRGNK